MPDRTGRFLRNWLTKANLQDLVFHLVLPFLTVSRFVSQRMARLVADEDLIQAENTRLLRYFPESSAAGKWSCWPKGSLASGGLPISGLLVPFVAQVLHEFTGMICLNAIRPGVDG